MVLPKEDLVRQEQARGAGRPILGAAETVTLPSNNTARGYERARSNGRLGKRRDLDANARL